jgi:endogenous inhibitor of DNA gyrase (YacG/DUF329 family)
MIDLGTWAAEKYRIAGDKIAEPEGDQPDNGRN